MTELKQLKAYWEGGSTVTVAGVTGRDVTVRVLLNPRVPKGMNDNAIYENYEKIPALDKKEERHAGRFLLRLSAGDAAPPYKVIVALSDGTVEWPPVEERGAEVVDSPSAEFSPATGTITVTGVAGANDTVRVLLNPTLNGMPDGQIFDNFAIIPALDKKEKLNAGSFIITLNAGNVGPPHTIVIVTSAGDVIRPLVEVALAPAPP